MLYELTSWTPPAAYNGAGIWWHQSDSNNNVPYGESVEGGGAGGLSRGRALLWLSLHEETVLGLSLGLGCEIFSTWNFGWTRSHSEYRKAHEWKQRSKNVWREGGEESRASGSACLCLKAVGDSAGPRQRASWLPGYNSGLNFIPCLLETHRQCLVRGMKCSFVLKEG